MKKFLYPLAMGMLIGAGVAAIVYAKINKADKEKKTKEAKNAKTYSLSTDYDWKSYLTLGEYKGLSLEKTVYTVTDEDVAEEVEYELTEEVTVTDRAIKKGDYADIDFTGTIDGEEFEGGSEEGYVLTVGDYEFLEEFEDSLIGHETGDEYSVDATFPDDYEEDESLAGKTASFKIKINEISEDQVHDSSDTDYIVDELGYESYEDMVKSIRADLEESNQADAEDSLEADALACALDACTISSYPEDLLQMNQDYVDEEIAETADMYGLEVSEYIEFFYGSEEDVTAYVEELTKQDLLFQAIADTEKITISRSEYEAFVEEYLDEEYTTIEAVEEAYGVEALADEAIKDKIVNLIIDQANVTEVQEDSQEEEYVDETEDDAFTDSEIEAEEEE